MEEEIIKKKWGSMTFWQKLEYIWMYYKVWLFVALALVGVIWLGITMYQGIHTKVLLNVVVVEGNSTKADKLAEEFTEYAGIHKKEGVVRMKTNVPNEDGTTSSQTVLTTLFGAEAVDVLICTKEVYEEYCDQDGFSSMEEVLKDEERIENNSLTEDALLLSDDSILKGEGIVAYDEIYLTIPVNCQNKEMAKQFIKYILSQSS